MVALAVLAVLPLAGLGASADPAPSLVPHDSFANAKAIPAPPFDEEYDDTTATSQEGEYICGGYGVTT